MTDLETQEVTLDKIDFVKLVNGYKQTFDKTDKHRCAYCYKHKVPDTETKTHGI